MTYTTASGQLLEWTQVQEWHNEQSRRLTSAKEFWRPLSPYPQLLILALFVAVSGVASFGRYETGYLKDWSGNNPLTVYFGLSLLTFNTASDSDALVQLLDEYLFFHSWLFLLAVIAFAGINAVPLARGWDYLFVKHPAADIVNTAVNYGTPIHGQSLARALMVNPQDIFNWRPRWHYEHQAEKAQKLSEKLDRDAELARAAIARERSRAELQDVKQASAADARESVWRGRTLT